MVIIKAGITAIHRVISRRSHAFKRMFKNPFITICPAKVPVSVEFWPDANNAIAKKY